MRTGESTLLIGGSGCRSRDPSSAPSSELSSGGSPRLESRDLEHGPERDVERSLPVPGESRLRRVEDVSQPE